MSLKAIYILIYPRCAVLDAVSRLVCRVLIAHTVTRFFTFDNYACFLNLFYCPPRAPKYFQDEKLFV